MDDRIFPEVELVDSIINEEHMLLDRITRNDSSLTKDNPQESMRQIQCLLDYYSFQHEKETIYLLTNTGKPATKLNYIEHKMEYIRDKIKRDREQINDINHTQTIFWTKIIVIVASLTMVSLVANAVINYLQLS